jgi:5-keto 4-deoxyuronate isomerase
MTRKIQTGIAQVPLPSPALQRPRIDYAFEHLCLASSISPLYGHMDRIISGGISVASCQYTRGLRFPT